MQIEDPYHEGELLVQQQAGEVEMSRRNRRAISVPKPRYRHGRLVALR